MELQYIHREYQYQINMKRHEVSEVDVYTKAG
jgi:hypothetical protein